MHYSQFCSAFSGVLHKKLGSETQFIQKTLCKNNGVCPDVLLVLSPGSSLGHVIYLEPLYYQYQKGMSMDAVCASAASFLERRPPFPSSICQDLLDPEYIRSRVAFRLVSRRRNSGLLDRVPWFPFHDLAMIFFVCLDPSCGELVSTLIHRQLLSAWDMDTDTLRRLAEENTPILFPPVLTPLSEILAPLSPELLPLRESEEADSSGCPEDAPPLHVLTNRQGICGASCMLYRDIIKDFADQEGADVIILPSSIHEVLLFPDHLTFDHALLRRMVQEINRTEVPEEDVLSDCIYIFRRETGTIIPSPPSSCHMPGPDGTESPW